MTATALTYYRCETCRRCFATEAQILDHQSLWSNLHSIDPEIDEHDGVAWKKVTLQPGDRFEYQGYSSTFVSAADPEQDECGFFYERVRRQYRGDVFSMFIPRVSEQLVRAWAAATSLGDLGFHAAQEIDVREYSRWLAERWYDSPERLAEERHTMLAMMAAVQLHEVTRQRGRR